MALPAHRGHQRNRLSLRLEVRAVDDLDHASVAAAALPTLSDEIEPALQNGENGKPHPEVLARLTSRTINPRAGSADSSAVSRNFLSDRTATLTVAADN